MTWTICNQKIYHWKFTREFLSLKIYKRTRVSSRVYHSLTTYIQCQNTVITSDFYMSELEHSLSNLCSFWHSFNVSFQPLRLDIKRKLSARSDRVKSVDLHPTEPWMLASLYNGNVHIWNHESQVTNTGPQLKYYRNHRERSGSQSIYMFDPPQWQCPYLESWVIAN